MKMQVLHALTAVFSDIGHDTITVFTAVFRAQIGDDREDMSQQRGILFGQSRR